SQPVDLEQVQGGDFRLHCLAAGGGRQLDLGTHRAGVYDLLLSDHLAAGQRHPADLSTLRQGDVRKGAANRLIETGSRPDGSRLAPRVETHARSEGPTQAALI